MTIEFGYHASHEQFPPSALLEAVRHADGLGILHGMCSDHFSPFSTAQGQSGFAWSWLGAALQATRMTFGTVTAPGQRYHPAIVAQGAATLTQMFPGRFWLALGSGENLNEHITGQHWPVKAQRQARLRECVEVMRALFAGETVTHAGLVTVERAKLYTRPEVPPPLFGAAVSAETAAWAARWADGLITVNQPREQLARVVEAFRENGGAGKPMYLQVHVALAKQRRAALEAAHEQWRTGALAGPLLWDVAVPEQLDEAARFVRPEDVESSVRVTNDVEELVGEFRADQNLGFQRIYVHEVGRDQQSTFRQLVGALTE
ncbi:MAG TPA: TIGR03885 family FMN-dependent LLM class oxidoreductase [Polyangiaceae bacterium]|nr:TIGR03885 family FMN-dependent LLM class oxidoreductase [Polyangiaceae bacterium]